VKCMHPALVAMDSMGLSTFISIQQAPDKAI